MAKPKTTPEEHWLEGAAEETRRAPREVAERKRLITFIARVFARRGLDVLPGGGWACGISGQANAIARELFTKQRDTLDDVPPETFRPQHIIYKEDDLARWSDDEVMGVLRHEVGHARHTDFKRFIEGMRFAIDDGHLPTTWSELWHANEDPWVNIRESEGSPAARERIGKLYERWTRDTEQHIATQPVTRQLTLNSIYYWLHGKTIPGLTDQRVLDVFEQIKEPMTRAQHAEETEEAQRILREEIWPKFKVLADAAQDDEQLKEMLNANGMPQGGGGGGEGGGEGQPQQGQPQNGEGGGGQGGSGKPSGQGSGGGGMLDKLRRGLGFKTDEEKEREQEQQRQAAREQLDDALRNATPEDLKRAIEEAAQRLPPRHSEQSEESHTEEQRPPTLADLPDDLKDKLRKAIDQLPQDLKEKLQKEARKQLDRQQAEGLNKHLPAGIQFKEDPETGEQLPEVAVSDPEEVEDKKKEVQGMIEQEDREKADQDARATELEDRRAKEREESERKARALKQLIESGFGVEEMEQFQKYQELEGSMAGQVRQFIDVIERYLPKKQERTFGDQDFYRGKRADKKKLVRGVLTGDERFWKRREMREAPEAAIYVHLLIDRTGSMQGAKMAESMKTAIFFIRVLKHFEIPLAISFFGEQVRPLTAFSDDFDDRAKRFKPKLMELGDPKDGSTNIEDPLRAANDTMVAARRVMPGMRGIAFLISDGGANKGLTGPALHELAQRIQQDFPVKGFALGGSKAELEAVLGEGNVVGVDQFDDLPKEAFGMLRTELVRLKNMLRG